MFRSIRTRFLVTLLFSVGVPFLAFGLFALDQMGRRLDEDIHALYLQKVATDTAERIKGILDRREWELKLLATATPMVKGVVSGAGQSHLQIQRWIDLNVSASTYELLLITDAQGAVQFSRPSPSLGADRQEEMAELVPRSVAGDAWFTTVMAQGQCFLDRHRSPYLHRSVAASQDPHDYCFGIGVAILADDGHTRIGALLGLVSWNVVQQELDTVAKYFQEAGKFSTGYAFMFANDGDQIIAHQNRGIYNTSLTGRWDLGVLSRAILDSVRQSGGQGTLEYEYPPGKLRRAGWRQVQRPPPCNWFVGVGINADDIFATARSFRGLLLLAVAFAAAAIVVWSWFISRLLLRRVAALRAASAQLATGDTSARVAVAGTDELAELGRAFNQMAEDLEKNRAALRLVERDAAWAEIARQVAHEIKNPLTPMRLSAQMLDKALDEGSDRAPEIARRTVKTVLSQTEALRRIASDFSLFAGRVDHKLVPVVPDQCLERLAELYAAGRAQGAIPVQVQPGAPGAQVLGDPEDLTRVLINLVNNSIDAMTEGDCQGQVVVRSRAVDGHVEIEVDDDGPGLPPEVQGKLFQPYFSTKSHGTGLGLAIVKRTIEGYGGAVSLVPRSERGTRALVRLPRARAEG